jgi:hypothetical protein
LPPPSLVQRIFKKKAKRQKGFVYSHSGRGKQAAPSRPGVELLNESSHLQIDLIHHEKAGPESESAPPTHPEAGTGDRERDP